MRNRINIRLVFFFLLGFTLSAYSQEEVKMTLPSSPAFSILDYEPSSVMRPTSNKDLGADLLNSFDKNGKLLMNIGMEVTPYWLQSRPLLTRDQYLNPTVPQCFIQSLNISAATVKDSATGNNKLGAGIRFKLFNGKPTDEYKELEKKLNSQLTISAISQACKANDLSSREGALECLLEGLKDAGYSKELIEQFKENCKEIEDKYDDSKEGIRAYMEAINEKVISASGTLIKQVAKLSKNREGFILEVAAASSFITTKNVQPLERTGVWVNASNYFSPTNAWTFTGRYMFASADSAITNTDIGISYIREVAGFNFSLEAMFRWYRAEVMDININNQIITRLEKGNTYRISAQGSYKIADNISVNISLGKDFDSPFIKSTSFFTLLGVNYSLFKPAKVDLAKKE